MSLLSKALVLKLFDGFTVQRWNDQMRPIDFPEIDKHALKSITAFVLAHYATAAGKSVNLPRLIHGILYEYMRRVALADIKSPVYNKIRSRHPQHFARLGEWVYGQYATLTEDQPFLDGFRAYLSESFYPGSTEEQIANAAHSYASLAEYRLIAPFARNKKQADAILQTLTQQVRQFESLPGVTNLLTEDDSTARFIDLFGELRHQVRWGALPRLPKTSVLGHSFYTGALAFIFAQTLSPAPCAARLSNAFFGGLFHDLPEALTRDIINPVKTSVDELPSVIAEIEEELIAEEVFPLLTTLPAMQQQIAWILKNEFANKYILNGETVLTDDDTFPPELNADSYSPYDGRLLKVCDRLAAFLEAHVTIQMGITPPSMQEAWYTTAARYRNVDVEGGVRIGTLYATLVR